MSTNHTPRGSLEDGARLYEERKRGTTWTVESEPEPTEVTPGTRDGGTGGDGTLQGGEELYRRRHGRAAG